MNEKLGAQHLSQSLQRHNHPPYKWRERTYPYFDSLPYEVESQLERENHVRHIIKKLFIAVKGDDLKGIIGNTCAPALAYWTRELRSWMELKFDMPINIRIKLLRFYFAICIGGIDGLNLDLMVNMYCYLAKDETLLRESVFDDLRLDWAKLTRILKKLAFPLLSSYDGHIPKVFSLISRLALASRSFAGYHHTPLVLEEVLPMFNLAKASAPHNIMTLMTALLPVVPLTSEGISPEALDALQKYPPRALLPTIFQLWSLNTRSPLFDFQCLDAISNLAGDALASELVPTCRYGIFAPDQLSLAFVAILRMLEVPVSYVGSPYIGTQTSASFKSDKEKRSRVSRAIATFVVCSFTGDECLEQDGIMDKLESLMHSIETFCHPSNHGPWIRIIIASVAAMIDMFSLRWNAHASGESIVPESRVLTEKVRYRFVLAMREVVFLSIHSKSSTVAGVSLDCLQGLAMLDPDLIIPRALKEIYPSLEGLLETHRTIAALNCLQVLARTIAKHPRYAVHLATLLHMSIPGVDANDLTKTLHTLSLIQSVALSVPFYNLMDTPTASENEDLSAIDCVSNDLNALSEDAPLPEYSPAALEYAIRHSTQGFEEFVTLFMGQLFSLLENLPDLSGSSKNGDLPEVHVINCLPPTMTAVLGACSPKLFKRVVAQVNTFVSNNVIHPATDAIAHICGSLVMVNPKVAFREMMPMLYTNVKYEIEENGAGSTRSGSEILPRDRALIWNLSCLNMALANAGDEILQFKDEIAEIIMFLRVNCKGHIIYHISNTLHHTLMSLTMTYGSDYKLIPPEEEENVSYSRHWGQRIDLSDIKNLAWHKPSREEIALAVELYTTHCKMSFDIVSGLISGASQFSSITEFSDIMLSSLTYIRTASSGMAILFDSRKKKCQDAEDAIKNDSAEEDDDDAEEQEEEEEDDGLFDSDMDLDDEEDDYDLLGGGAVGAALSDIFEADDDWEGDVVDGTLRKYPANYFFGDKYYNNSEEVQDSLYRELHDMRDEVGDFLHRVHLYLIQNRENDFSSFKALMFAYKVWFSDVGTERSVRPLECLIALYSYETKNFRFSGLRKDYPRPILARRANLYHNERLSHNIGPRLATNLEKVLVNDILESVLSIYSDIHRNAQSALESAAKVLIRGRQYMYPVLLKATNQAFNDQEYKKGESGLRSLKARVLSASIKRDYKHVIPFTDVIIRAMQTDYPGVSDLATELYTVFASNLRLPLNTISLEQQPLEDLAEVFGGLEKEDETQIIKMKSRKESRRKSGLAEMEKLVAHLLDIEEKSGGRAVFWKYQAASAAVYAALCSSPQMPVDPRVIVDLCSAAGLNQHPGVKAMSNHALLRILNKLIVLGASNYNWNQFLLDYNDGENEKVWNADREFFVEVSERLPGYGEEFIEEMRNVDNPKYYVDQTKVGWLVWPSRFIAEFAQRPREKFEWSQADTEVMKKLGELLTAEWVVQMIARHCEEPRHENESLHIMNIYYFKMILEIIELGYAPIDMEFIYNLITELYNSTGATDKNVQRCVAELCQALLETIKVGEDDGGRKMAVVKGIFDRAINRDLSQETLGYWRSFAWAFPASVYMDYRRVWPLLEIVNDYQISEDSTSTFKISSKLSLQRRFIQSIGWYYQPVEQSLDILWNNIAHNFKGVRDEIGKTLAAIYISRFHLSFDSVPELLDANIAAGPTGVLNNYTLGPLYHRKIIEAFERLEEWRKIREPGDISAKYILGAKTISIWLSRILKSTYANCLIPLLPDVIIPTLLQFLNIRDDSELTVHAVDLFNMLGNLAYPLSAIQPMIDAIVDIGTRVSKWHQRISVLSFTQAFFFRQMFLMSDQQRHMLVDTVTYLLSDSQLEVRELAADTLAGMIRCSSKSEQGKITSELQIRFTDLLKDTQTLRMIKTAALSRVQSSFSLANSRTGSGTSTPTGTGVTTVAVQRHSAVLGLGSLVKAFPYLSPPPRWVPEVLATLAVLASGDSGMVGKSVKSTLSDFKKTRQDTWHIDSKVFSADQLEDLDGVLWKNYFV